MFATQLWIPLLASAVFVFVASSLIHMVLKWHNSDFHRLPNEDEVRSVIRAGNPAPGLYITPYCDDMNQFAAPDFQKKFTDGPVGHFTLRAPGLPLLRVTGLLSFLTYFGGSVQAGIWMGKPWGAVAKDFVDSLIYGAVTGAAFAWLWPR